MCGGSEWSPQGCSSTISHVSTWPAPASMRIFTSGCASRTTRALAAPTRRTSPFRPCSAAASTGRIQRNSAPCQTGPSIGSGASRASSATGALSGAVLLTAINNQFGGNIGYTIAVEYAFYVFFGLSLLCVLAVLGAELLRVAGHEGIATRTERWTRSVFLLAVAGTVVGTWITYWNR